MSKRLLVWLLALAACGQSSPSPPSQQLGFQFPQPSSPVSGIPIFNVLSYGAHGDGIVDDRAASTSAMNAACSAGGGIVYFPAGTYIWSRNGANAWSIDLPCGNLTLLGVRGKTWIKHPTGMPNTAVALLRADALDNIVIRDMGFDGNWGNAVTHLTESSSNLALSGTYALGVESTSGFPGGTVTLQVASTAGRNAVTCTGRTATTFTSCTGGSGTVMRGYAVGYIDATSGINQATQGTNLTTIAVASDGAALPQATINVASTTGYTLTSGSVSFTIVSSLGQTQISCTGITSTTFTGCTGGVGTLHTGQEVAKGYNPQNWLVMLRGVHGALIEGSQFRQAYGDCIGIYASSVDATRWSQNTRIHNVDCDMAARDGISFGGASTDTHIDNFRATNIMSQAIDAEPQGTPVRNVTVESSYLDTWWQPLEKFNSPLSIVGGSPGDVTRTASALNWKVHDNTILGTTFIERASDVVFERNHVVQDWDSSGGAGLVAEIAGEDITVADNYFYSRVSTVSGDAGTDNAAIIIYNYSSGTYGGTNPILSTPTTVHVRGNSLRVVNGRNGITILSSGGKISTATGTATGVTALTMTDSGASWTVNQWTGYQVWIGTAVAAVASNTATTLTLTKADNSTTSAWSTSTGAYAPTPAAAGYKIRRNTGVVDVENNDIDLRDDGHGAGHWGIYTEFSANDLLGMRVRIRDNKIKDANADAIHVKFDTSSPYYLLDLERNFAFDDQATPTTTNVIAFTGTPTATKWIMSGNAKGENVTNVISGLSSGNWLVEDGLVQRWAGFGSPETVVTAPIGSTDQRLDGGASTSTYVKESGTGNTGWVAK